MQDEAERAAPEIPSKQPGRQWTEITSKERLPCCWQLGMTEKLLIQLVPLKCLQKHWKNWQEKSSMWHQKKKKLLNPIMGMTEKMPGGPKQSGDSREIQMGLTPFHTQSLLMLWKLITNPDFLSSHITAAGGTPSSQHLSYSWNSFE